MGGNRAGLFRRIVGAAVLGTCLVSAPLSSLAAAFTVKSGGDVSHSGATPCTSNAATCTLRDAISEANQTVGSHAISFDPTVVQVTLVNGGGLYITAPVTLSGNPVTRTIINGGGQACFSLGDAATAQHPNGANGSYIQNLVIQNCNGYAISANGHDLHILNNYIGTDITGTSSGAGIGNTGDGISLSSSHVYTLGPQGLLDIYNALPVTPVDPSTVSNYIASLSGNLVTALTALTQPVYVTGNVISGNGGNGLTIFSENLAGVLVSGNRIGTDTSGNVALPNAGSGVQLIGNTFGNLIGPNNIISGNGAYGIDVEAGAVVMPNFIVGNVIGLSSTPGNHIGNALSGIYVGTSSPQTDPTKPNPSGMSLMIGPDNVIADNQGGSSSIDPDFLSNTEAGIFITGATTSGVKVIGNTIGIPVYGGTPQQSNTYGNAGDGIRITASSNTIGGSSAADANIIAANGRHGIVVNNTAAGNNILGNYIGVHPGFAGVLNLGNKYDGIHLDKADNTAIGGSGASDGNTIAGNGRNGVRIQNGDQSHGWGNLLQRNLIYANARNGSGGVGIDLDYQLNQSNVLHVEDPTKNANLDQAQVQLCLGTEPSGACNGSNAVSSTGSSVTVDWTLATHGPADFRVEFFSIDASDENSATSATFLGEALVTSDSSANLSSGSANTTCTGVAPGRCTTTIATNAQNLVATVTDVTPITNTPSNGGDWKGMLKCFVGNLGIVLSNCPVNDTSEFSNVVTPVQPQAQTITNFTANPASGVVGGTSALSATGGGSSNAVTFASSTPAVCTVSGSTVSYVATGTCTVTADQAGDASYTAAPQVTLNITVSSAPLTTQTITNFAANPASGTVGSSSTLSATGGGSGNAVTFGSNTLAVCTVSGSTVSYVATGTCTVTADQAGNASYSAAPQVTLDITVNSVPLTAQTITNFAANPASGTVGGTSTLSATGGGSGNAVTFGSNTLAVCTVSGSTVSYVATGTCTVTADQAGNASYSAAPQVTLDITVNSVPLTAQTITNFAANPTSGTVGGTSTLSATGGGSGNAVTFGSNTLAVCTVSGGTVSYVATGTCTVTADQAGNASYSAAPQITLDITVNSVPLTAQTITNFAASPASGTVGGTSTLSATGGGSGNAVTFGSNTPAVCTVSGSVVSYVATGTCTVTANQAGNASYSPAPQVVLTITVNSLTAQAIANFAASPSSGQVGGTSTLSATGGGSGNPVLFASTTPAICTVSGSTVSYLATGTCTVTANQAGNASYSAAPQVSLNITVNNLAAQAITNFAASPSSGKVGGTSTLSATGGGSGNAVVFASTTPAICTVSGSTVSYLATGTCTVTANQAGNASYNAAPQVSLNITVNALTAQTITNFAATPATGSVNGTSALSATGGGSGNPVTFASASPAICTVSGSTVTYVAAGTCVVTADQAGNASYNPAGQVSLNITVSAAVPTLGEWATLMLFGLLGMVGMRRFAKAA